MISIRSMRGVEGRQVDVSLVDGTRLEGCSLVSVGRLWARTVWLVSGETDLFVSIEDIADVSVLRQQQAAA